jgi:hypothetical protein
MVCSVCTPLCLNLSLVLCMQAVSGEHHLVGVHV